MRKWQPSAEVGAVEAVVADVDAAEVEVAVATKPSPALPKAPRTLTCLLETSSGVGCILNTGKMHFSVVIHQRVLGKMSLPKSQQNNEK